MKYGETLYGYVVARALDSSEEAQQQEYTNYINLNLLRVIGKPFAKMEGTEEERAWWIGENTVINFRRRTADVH